MSNTSKIGSAFIGNKHEWELLVAISAELPLPDRPHWQQVETPASDCTTLISLSVPQLWQLLEQYPTHSPIILLLPEKDEEIIGRAMSLGCQDCLSISELTPALLSHTLQISHQRFAYHQQLHHKITALKESDRIKGKFVSDVSHELRTPITALSLHVDLLERGHPERRDHYIRVIRTEVAWLRELVLDILKLSRFDLGHLQTSFFEVDFNNIILRELALYRERIEKAGLTLIFESADNLPLLWGEPTQLSDMFTHLLDNALTYTKTGFIHLQTKYIQETDELYCLVEDSGIGIAEDEQELVFGRFYRGVNNQSISGSGLGLNLAQEIVKLHGGKITLTSQVDVGSKFEITLPRIYPPNLPPPKVKSISQTNRPQR